MNHIKVLSINDLKFKIKVAYIRKSCHVRILSDIETIKYIVKNRCNVSRFGDGEFNLLIDRDGPGFQKNDIELKKALESVFEDDENLLICIPHFFKHSKKSNIKAKKYWDYWCYLYQQDINQTLMNYCSKITFFGDSLFTRPYFDYLTNENANKVFKQLPELWNGEDIIIIEGEKTRLGIGNDLFNNVNSIKRVLCPAINAFDCINDIMNFIKTIYNGELVLIALGPTATVLASNFSKIGVWAIDIGHIDVEYEWYKMNAKEKVPIYGKYVNEAGSNISNVEDCNDELYISQIIKKIGC